MGSPVTNHERMKPNLEAQDVSDAGQIWVDGEMTPLPVAPLPRRTGMLGRVADFGDLGDGTPSPYEPEIQAEVLARETERQEASLDEIMNPTVSKTK